MLQILFKYFMANLLPVFSKSRHHLVSSHVVISSLYSYQFIDQFFTLWLILVQQLSTFYKKKSWSNDIPTKIKHLISLKYLEITKY